jgi:hypothetical protein
MYWQSNRLLLLYDTMGVRWRLGSLFAASVRLCFAFDMAPDQVSVPLGVI